MARRNDAESLCNGQWRIFRDTVVCLTEIGDAPHKSYFETASRFFWVADQPYRVRNDAYVPFLPDAVIGGRGNKRSIRLFVRPRGSERYVYLGELAPSYAQQAAGRENHGMANFELRPALPSSVWLDLGGLQLGNLDFAPVDQGLGRLRNPTSVDDRLGILRQLVEFWHGPIKPEDGMSDAELAGVALPLPLRWWYRWAGKRSEVMSGQNILFAPRDEQHKYWQLAVEDGRLQFYVENQGVYQWATLPDGDDPPVFGRYNESWDHWEQENVTLSEHLILACLFEAVTCHAKYGASASWLEEQRFTEIVKHIPPVAIGPWRWVGMTFFAGRGAFMCAGPNGELDGKDGYSVWIGAKTEHPLQFLRALLDESWEYVAV